MIRRAGLFFFPANRRPVKEVFPLRLRLLKNKTPRPMTLAAQCEAASFSVLYGAATVMERGIYRVFQQLAKAAGTRLLRTVFGGGPIGAYHLSDSPGR
jgi:hypothetical protein